MRYSVDTESECRKENLCELYRRASQIAKPKRGVKPSFTVSHVIALLILASFEPMGRPSIARLLGLGDTATKTLIRRAREAGVIVSEGRRGIRATDEIASLIDSVSPCMLGRCIGFSVGCEPWCSESRGLASLLRFRDELVKRELDVMLISCCYGEVRVPGASSEYATEVKTECSECMSSSTTCILLRRDARLLDVASAMEAAAVLICNG